jgi:membrane protease subunit HflC
MHFVGLPHAHDQNGRSQSFWPRALAAGLVALAAWLAWRTLFFVDETEYIYVTQFGEPLRLYTQPGLGIKWPYQSLWRFDRRLQIYEPPPREMLTQDKENLNFEWYDCWRIAGPAAGKSTEVAGAEAETSVRRFLQSLGGTQAAESRLEERIQAALAAEIGRTRLAQLVSLEPNGVAIEPIMARVTAGIRRAAAEQFGIDVVDVRLKRFNYPEAVKPAVYAEIRSERQRVAVQYRAEGESEKIRIESQATLARDRLLAQARREATRLRGEGEASAIEIYNAAHAQNPAFYQLLKTLETYRSILDEQTTVVLSGDSPLLKLLTQGLPDLPTESPHTLPSEASTAPPAAAAPMPRTSATRVRTGKPGAAPNSAPTLAIPEAQP